MVKNISILSISVSHSRWVKHSSIGGGEIRTVNILNEYTDQGISICSLELFPSLSKQLGYSTPVSEIHFPLILKHGVKTPIPAIIGLLYIFTTFVTRGFFLRKHYSHILSSTSNLIDLLPSWFLAKITRKPFIIVYQTLGFTRSLTEFYNTIRQDTGPIRSLFHVLSGLLTIHFSNSAFAIFSVSDKIKKMLQSLKLKPYIISTSNGINFKEIENIPNNSPKYDAIYIGRIEKIKGSHDLLHIWKKVCSTKINANLLILGDGHILDEIKRKSIKMGLSERITFLGFVGAPQKYYLMKQSKIFITPSLSESFGISIAEALACGLPVVCYDDIKTSFDKCNSIFSVPTGDVSAFPSIILDILNNKDLELLRNISESYAKINFNLKQIVSAEINVLNHLLQENIGK